MRRAKALSALPALSALLGLLALLGPLGGCATNPATGAWQLSLYGEQQEIAMGQQNDEQIVATLGLYGDDALQGYVDGVGQRMAAGSERPDLPWSFRVVDDPVVNAFALPGGFIYLTRGILSHFTNEAQMAAVLGHEIGHVTARHSVNQMSKAQLANIGLAVGMIAVPELQALGGLAQSSLTLLFLKYGRDAEREADTLGLRYMQAQGYEPWEMHEVFQMLANTRGEDAAALPGWLLTHPDPDERARTVAAQFSPPGAERPSGRVEGEGYLSRLDGMVFGEDPREGFFRGAVFYHPGLAFQLRFPEGWKLANQKQAVLAGQPDGEAVVQLSAAGPGDARSVAERFFAENKLSASSAGPSQIGGLPAFVAGFSAQSQQGAISGTAGFVELDGRVFRILGYAPSQAWSRHASSVAGSIGSFARLSDPALLGVEPAQLRIATLPARMSLREFDRRYPSSVDLATLALVNQVDPDAPLPAGRRVKRVVGGVGSPPGAN